VGREQPGAQLGRHPGVFALLGITPVPQLYRGPFDASLFERMARNWNSEREEGFVVRAAGPIRYEDFGSSVAKWVRPAHVQTDEHWMHAAIVPNKLAAQEFRHDSLLLDAEFDACSPHARG